MFGGKLPPHVENMFFLAFFTRILSKSRHKRRSVEIGRPMVEAGFFRTFFFENRSASKHGGKVEDLGVWIAEGWWNSLLVRDSPIHLLRQKFLVTELGCFKHFFWSFTANSGRFLIGQNVFSGMKPTANHRFSRFWAQVDGLTMVSSYDCNVFFFQTKKYPVFNLRLLWITEISDFLRCP